MVVSPNDYRKIYQFDKKKNKNNVLCGLSAGIADANF